MIDIEQVAKELWTVWNNNLLEQFPPTVVQIEYGSSETWEELDEFGRKAWIAVAEYVVKESVELAAILLIPDHR